MKKIILALVFTLFLLPKPAFAQSAECHGETYTCGQETYGNCTFRCFGHDAGYYCTQTDNEACQGNILCPARNSECAPTAPIQPTNPNPQTSVQPTSSAYLVGSITASPNPVTKKLDGTYPQISLNITANTGWKVFIYNGRCTGCSLTVGWTQIDSGSGNRTVPYQPPAYLTGVYTIALFDTNATTITNQDYVTFQAAASGGTNPTAPADPNNPNTTVPDPNAPNPANPQTPPVTKPGEQPALIPKKPVKLIFSESGLNDLTIDNPVVGSEVKFKLYINDPVYKNLEADHLVRVTVQYEDGSMNTYVVNFHYQPNKIVADPKENQTKEVKVLELNYFSPGIDTTSTRNKVKSLTEILTHFLTEASKYHGYKDKSVQPALTYNVIEAKEVNQSLPSSTYHIPYRNQAILPDYNKVLTDQNICDYVDNKGVKQVWIWSDHLDSAFIDESNMSMGTDSKSFWDYSDYGDVSNSQRINDLPTCKKTYTLFNFNYTRSTGEMYESFGHQLEAVFRWIDDNLFWSKFVNPTGDTNGINHCGWIHIPPNVKAGHDYDWVNETTVKSDCEDWKPDGGGQIKDVNCHTWYQYISGRSCPKNSEGFASDTGAAYKIWWMQNLPGLNNGLTYKGNKLRNWWSFIGDFDTAIAAGKSLVQKTNKTTVQSANDSFGQSTTDYVPPASLPHPSYSPQSLDINNDGTINTFDWVQNLGH